MFYFISTDLTVGISPIYGFDGLHIDDDERKTSVKLNNKLAQNKTLQRVQAPSDNSGKNLSLAEKFSQFRRHNNCCGGYMQNRLQNHGP